MRWGFMSTVAEPHMPEGGMWHVPHPALWRMCAPGVLPQGAVSMFSVAGVRLPHQRSYFYRP